MSISVDTAHAFELEITFVHRWTIFLALHVEEDDSAHNRDEVEWKVHQVLQDVSWLELGERCHGLLAHSLPDIASASDFPAVRDQLD